MPPCHSREDGNPGAQLGWGWGWGIDLPALLRKALQAGARFGLVIRCGVSANRKQQTTNGYGYGMVSRCRLSVIDFYTT